MTRGGEGPLTQVGGGGDRQAEHVVSSSQSAPGDVACTTFDEQISSLLTLHL